MLSGAVNVWEFMLTHRVAFCRTIPINKSPGYVHNHGFVRYGRQYATLLGPFCLQYAESECNEKVGGVGCTFIGRAAILLVHSKF